jgi:hypothetical protein
MKKYTQFILSGLVLAAGCLTACQDEDATGATGEVSVRILADNALATSRAEVTPTQQMDLDVLDMNGGIVKAFKDAAATTVERFTLPVGSYVFHAYSANKNSTSPYFDEGNAYYEVRDTLQITKGSMNDVKLVCTLAMAKVSVNYTDELKTNFTQLDCTVKHSSGELLYNKEESRAGYFPASGDLTVSLAVTNVKGNSYATEQTISHVAPRTHYRINYSLAANTTGTGDFQITYDPTLNEMTFEVGIPLKSPYEVNLQAPDVYGKVAYLYAQSTKQDNTGLAFQYRLKGSEDWVTVSAEEKTIDGEATFVGKTNELEFATEYEYRMAVGNQEASETHTFTTESYVEVPNLGFDDWNSAKNLFGRTNWYPNTDASNSYWATGNEGVTTLKSSNSTPVEGENARTGKAARLKTIEISMAGYAAGNILIGDYSTDMENAANSVKFGRAYEGARPLKLKGWYKYTATAISNTDGQVPADENYTEDTGDIYIKLWDGEDTSTANVIAEAHFYPEGTVDTYTEFEIPITYTSRAKAKWMTIVCTSSRYGGYFSGMSVIGKVGTGSTLWVDDFELEYYK